MSELSCHWLHWQLLPCHAWTILHEKRNRLPLQVLSPVIKFDAILASANNWHVLHVILGHNKVIKIQVNIQFLHPFTLASFNDAICVFLLTVQAASLLLDASFLFKNLPIEICEIREEL